MESIVAKRKESLNSLVLDCHKYLFELSQALTTFLDERGTDCKSFPHVKNFETQSTPADNFGSPPDYQSGSKTFFKGGFFLGNHHSQPCLIPVKDNGGQDMTTYSKLNQNEYEKCPSIRSIQGAFLQNCYCSFAPSS
jgi:hypothetical protein